MAAKSNRNGTGTDRDKALELALAQIEKAFGRGSIMRMSDSAIEESDEDKPGVVIDYYGEGNIIGLEVLEASKRIGNPKALDYAVTG